MSKKKKLSAKALICLMIDNGLLSARDLLIEASRRGVLPVVEVLLEAGARVDIDDNAPLRWACLNGHEKVVKTLLKAGADPENFYARDWAKKRGQKKIIKLLNKAAKKKKV